MICEATVFMAVGSRLHLRWTMQFWECALCKGQALGSVMLQHGQPLAGAGHDARLSCCLSWPLGSAATCSCDTV